MAKTIIIGGGVAGLIAAYYNPESIVIDKNPLGQLNTPFIPGPRLLKVDEYTENFLKNLGIKFHKETINIGYSTNGDTLVENNTAFKEKYSKWTRGTSKIESSFLSSGESQIEIFTDGSNDFYNKVFQKLYDTVKNQIISATVKEINVKSKVIKTDADSYVYKNLISTINLKILCKLLNIDEIVPKTTDKNFVCCSYNNKRDKELSEKYHYIYCINGIYSRKTYFENYIVYETLIPFKDDIDNIDGNKIIGKANNLPIQIVNSIDIRNLKGIELLGRFAQWNHSIKATELIEYYETKN